MGGLRRIAATSAMVTVVVAAALGSFPSAVSASTPAPGQAAPVLVAAATPTAVPRAPFIEEVIPEGLGVLVNWNPNPATDDVTKYKLSAVVATGFTGTVPGTCGSPPVISAPGTDSSALMTKLCAGVPYAISMKATNAAGTSAKSAVSHPVVPLVAQPPTSPLITSVLPRSGGLVINWSAPSITGGDPLTGFTLKATTGATKVTKSAAATVTQLTLTGLTNGTAYTLSLVATSMAGNSAPGTGTGTPSATAPPTAPVSLQVVPDGNGHLVVTWSAPGDSGTSAVTGYTVTTQAETEASGVWSPTGSPTTQNLGPSATTTTLTGLAPTGFYA